MLLNLKASLMADIADGPHSLDVKDSSTVVLISGLDSDLFYNFTVRTLEP